MKVPLHAASLALLLAAVPAAVAFDGHVATEGPLTLTIGPIADVTEYDVPRAVRVTAKNSGTSPLAIRLRMGGLVDEWRAMGESRAQLEIPAGEAAEATFRIAAGKGACSALYPAHVYATFGGPGRQRTAHAVQIFRARFARRAGAAGPQALPTNVVAPGGALALSRLRTHRVAWRYYDGPLKRMPVGWQGSAPGSAASFSRGPVTRGTSRQALQMHPPWKPGGGTVFAEYRLRLPNIEPIALLFANAIRDHTASEPPSDGVTFRVWAAEADRARDGQFEKLFDRHTDSKRWLDGRADLSKFAGKELVVRLESHPGPKRDTTCDSSYWGEPTVVAGTPPVRLTEAQRRQFRLRAERAVASGRPAGRQEFVFPLDGGCAAALVLGPAGLADCALAFGQGRRRVVFDGLRMSVLRQEVGRRPSAIAVRGVDASRDLASGKVKVVHRCLLDGEAFDLTATVWAEGAGLRVRFEAPRRITDLALGPADRRAPRVYYGHGYCIVEPKAFRAGFGGHNLSTSHVGFDFAGGVSLLVATDHPPDFLEVSPDQRLYALHTHLDATLTFVPGVRGAFDCARRYRPLYDKKAAGGFRRKAGRFVFDIWGGRYAEIAETMKRMIAYGLTDSLLTVHVWQRWGYDYRLPDIYPPLPSLGTVEDMRKIADVCAAADIPWGLHDNYIDFYPDAEGYSYEHVCFTEAGEPVMAWLNAGRSARSYRWRPDRFLPFAKRNLELIKPGVRPTHYFIDVFTSIGPFDFYDKQGKFHSFLETRRHWGEVFAWIREYLGGNAPTTSEAGHDQLTGCLDGADCQHLQLSPTGRRFCIRLPCRDWQRVPWFDAVLHDKFSLHGVGYSGRYQGGRSRRDHGIESDDYLSAEVLEGHALMIDRGGFGRGAVRKYWLAQDLIRSLALDAIEDVTFVDGDIHRQIVRWTSGARVHVNRGLRDWHVAGRTLPQYGYLAANAGIESSIERIGGVIVERSRAPGRWYVNARGFRPDTVLWIRPSAKRLEYLGGRRFKLPIQWTAERPAPKDLGIFVHFNSDRVERPDRIAFQGDHAPSPPTSRWRGAVVTGADRVLEVPDEADLREFEITVGLWDPAGGGRYALLGEDDGSRRYRLGRLVVERSGGKVTNIRLVPRKAKPEPPARWNVQGEAVDFGPIMTAGALRCEAKKGALVVTPLPDLDAFAVGLRIEKLTSGRAKGVQSIAAVDAGGRTVRSVPFEAKAGLVSFRTRKGEFAYRIKTADAVERD